MHLMDTHYRETVPSSPDNVLKPQIFSPKIANFAVPSLGNSLSKGLFRGSTAVSDSYLRHTGSQFESQQRLILCGVPVFLCVCGVYARYSSFFAHCKNHRCECQRELFYFFTLYTCSFLLIF